MRPGEFDKCQTSLFFLGLESGYGKGDARPDIFMQSDANCYKDIIFVFVKVSICQNLR